MSYVNLDDSFAQHPKVIGLSDAAFRAQVVAMCYSGAYLTDGFIPKGHTDPEVAMELVNALLWEPMANGWQLHDWKDWNLTANEWRERKQKRSEQRSKAGSKGAAKRWRGNSPDPDPDPEPDLDPDPDSKTLAASPRKERPTDPIWDVLVECYGKPTSSAKGKREAAAKTLRDYGADPEDIRSMIRALNGTAKSWAVTTDVALAAHFGERVALIGQAQSETGNGAARWLAKAADYKADEP